MPEMPETIHLIRRCDWCKKFSAIEVKSDDYIRWESGGALIQEVWPDLSADEREILLSGCHPACWEEQWGEPDDEPGAAPF